MQGIEAEKVGCRSQRGSGAFALPASGRDVVGEGANSAFPTVMLLDEDVLVSDLCCELQIGVCDGAQRVVG
jgi:hypothetical protein